MKEPRPHDRRHAAPRVLLLLALLASACARQPAPDIRLLGDDGRVALDEVRAAFNARPDATRVLALLSPT